MNIKESIGQYHSQLFGKPALLVAAPGRVNIIGEHTDYNGGMVLPYALDRHIYLTASRLEAENVLHVYSADYKRYVDFSIPEGWESWCAFFTSVQRVIMEDHGPLPGLEITMLSDLPANAGLSSSSALTCGILSIYNHFMDLDLNADQLIAYAIKAEHGTGVIGGAMDQTTIMKAKKDQALWIDFGMNKIDSIPFNLPFFLIHTDIEHSLVTSEYNLRRQQCEMALEQVNNHYSTNHSFLSQSNHQEIEAALADPLLKKRASFVLEENQRVVRIVDLLADQDLEAIGRQLLASHEGLSLKYEVSTPEIDWLVQSISREEKVYGARLIGGGFGGCVLVLADTEAVAILERVTKAYNDRFTKRGRLYKADSGPGLITESLI